MERYFYKFVINLDLDTGRKIFEMGFLTSSATQIEAAGCFIEATWPRLCGQIFTKLFTISIFAIIDITESFISFLKKYFFSGWKFWRQLQF